MDIGQAFAVGGLLTIGLFRALHRRAGAGARGVEPGAAAAADNEAPSSSPRRQKEEHQQQQEEEEEEEVDLRGQKCGWLAKSKAAAINGDLEVMRRFVGGLPKAELHLHIEGTFEPDLMLKIAKRNKLHEDPAWCARFGYGGPGDDRAWIERQRAKRQFKDLEEFLRLYYAGCEVLKTAQDFYDLAWAYLERASRQNVAHVEMFFDPQTHCVEIQQLDMDIVFDGLHRACLDAATPGKLPAGPVSAKLILCFLRHRHERSAILASSPQLPPARPDEARALLQEVLDRGHRDKIVAVGLDSSEGGNPPGLFAGAFALARSVGLRCVAHAGEEGPAAYVTEALDVLQCCRIDHGVRCLEDPAVARRLAAHGIPLTVCPCSNHRLQVNRRFFGGENPVRQLLEAGLKVTLNSDDPAFFFGHRDKFGESHGGYAESCYVSTAKEVGLGADELVMLALNSFEASFLTFEELQGYRARVRAYCEGFEV